MYAMIDARVFGLGFFLYQKDSDGHCSLLQVGSTCLSNALTRWYPAELELLAVQYCLKKCHFYIALSEHTITVYSHYFRIRYLYCFIGKNV